MQSLTIFFFVLMLMFLIERTKLQRSVVNYSLTQQMNLHSYGTTLYSKKMLYVRILQCVSLMNSFSDIFVAPTVFICVDVYNEAL